MPSEKTKKILEGLGNIATKTQIKEENHLVVSNEYGEDSKGKIIYIDRMYGDMFGDHKLIQKNHKQYTGKIHKRRRLVKGLDDNSFFSACFETADGRWFDNSGMPMEAPTNVEEEVAKVEPGFVKRELTDEEKSEIARHNTAREQQLLAKLK